MYYQVFTTTANNKKVQVSLDNMQELNEWAAKTMNKLIEIHKYNEQGLHSKVKLYLSTLKAKYVAYKTEKHQ